MLETHYCKFEEIPLFSLVFSDINLLLVKISEDEMMSFPSKFKYCRLKDENFEIPSKETLLSYLNKVKL